MTKSTEKILQEITILCREEKSCTKTNGYFSDKLGVAIKTVSRSIKKLNDDKYIGVQRVDNLRKIILLRDINRKEQDIVEKQSIRRMTDEEVQQDMDKLIEIPQEQEDELQSICKKYDLTINYPKFFSRKIRAYSKYRTFEQIKQVVKNYFEEHEYTKYNRSTLSQYLDLKCVDRVDIKKIKMEVGLQCR